MTKLDRVFEIGKGRVRCRAGILINIQCPATGWAIRIKVETERGCRF